MKGTTIVTYTGAAVQRLYIPAEDRALSGTTSRPSLTENPCPHYAVDITS